MSLLLPSRSILSPFDTEYELDRGNPLANGIIGWWPTRHSGYKQHDLSGQANNATLTGLGASSGIVAGRFGSGVRTTDVTGERAPLDQAMAFGSSCTFWMLIDKKDNQHALWFGNTAENRYACYTTGSTFYVRTNTGYTALSGVGIGTGEHRIVIRRVGTSSWEWFDNGISQGVGTRAGTVTVESLINYNAAGSTFAPNAITYEQAIWNRALTDAEIYSLAQDPHQLRRSTASAWVPYFEQSAPTVEAVSIVAPSRPVLGPFDTEYVLDRDNPIIQDGAPVLWLPGRGLTGVKSWDLSGYGNHATQTAVANRPSVVASERGLVSDFDGTNDYLSVTKSWSLSAVTVSAWLYCTSVADYRDVVRDAVFNVGLYIYIDKTSAKVVSSFGPETGTSASDFNKHTSTAAFPLNQWVLLTLTYDGSLVTQYVNGAEEGSTNESSGGPLSVEVTNLKIGAQRTGASEFFSGKMTDLTIFPRALSATEVQSLYQDPYQLRRSTAPNWLPYVKQVPPTPVEPVSFIAPSRRVLGPFDTEYELDRDNPLARGLAAWWPGKDIASSKLPDLSGNGYDAIQTTATKQPAIVASERGLVSNPDGTDDYWDLSRDLSFGATEHYSYSWWLKVPVGGTYFPGLWRSNNNYGWWCSAPSGRLWGRHNGSDVASFSTGPIVFGDKWRHVSVTWDGSVVRMYADGSETHTLTISTGNAWYINKLCVQSTDYINGLHTDIAFWRRALSATEVQSLYADPYQLRRSTAPRWMFKIPDAVVLTRRIYIRQGMIF